MTQRPLLRSHDPRADDEGEGAGECLAFYWCEVSSCLVRRIGKRGGGRHAVTCGVKRERARDASDGKGQEFLVFLHRAEQALTSARVKTGQVENICTLKQPCATLSTFVFFHQALLYFLIAFALFVDFFLFTLRIEERLGSFFHVFLKVKPSYRGIKRSPERAIIIELLPRAMASRRQLRCPSSTFFWLWQLTYIYLYLSIYLSI